MKKKRMNRHHLRPKSRKGGNEKSNIAIFHIDRHENWHRVFGNKTLDEIIELLIRFRDIKNAQKRKE